MRKIFQVLLFLCIMIVSISVATSNFVSASEKNDVEVWSTYSSKKIMKDKIYEDDEKLEPKLQISMAKNEIEGGQLIITPKYDVNSYNITTTDLVNTQGDKILKDQIKIYNQKYILVDTKVSPNPEFTEGYIPDAILPFEKAIEYGENKISKNCNQGIYITVETTKETKSGIYKAVFKLEVDKTVFYIDVIVNVWDFAISDETHARSVFAIWQDDIMAGELDSTYSMYEKYGEMLLDHRLSPLYPITEDETLESFIEGAIRATQDVRATAYQIKYTHQANDEFGYEVDYNDLKNTLKLLIKNSNENLYLLDKAVYYFGDIIDEPQNDPSGKTLKLAQRVLNKVNEVEELVYAELLAEGFFNDKSEEFKNKILKGLRSIPNLLTTAKNSMFDGGIGTYVPTIDNFDSPNDIEYYQEQKELNGNLWWYTCVWPVYPYASYHIDDSLLGARLLSYMQYDYGIDGNLYWATTLYRKIQLNSKGEGNITRPTDPYNDPKRMSDRYSANGDGYLFYPGRPYGIDGPVSSLRLEAIRDGLEEYEYLYYLDTVCQQLNEYYGLDDITTNSIMENIYKRLYSNTQYNPDYLNFETIRNEIGQLIENTTSDEMFVLRSIINDGINATVQFCLNGEYQVYYGNELLTGVNSNNGKLYTLKVKLDKSTNVLPLVFKKGNIEKLMSLNLGGMSKLVSSFDDESSIALLSPVDSNVNISFNTDNQYVLEGGSIKCVLDSKFNPNRPSQYLSYRPSIVIDFKNLIFNTNDLNEVRLSVYNANEQKLSVSVVAYAGVNKKVISTFVLEPGKFNEISITKFYALNWKYLSETDSIKIEFENMIDATTPMPQQIVYIDNLIVIARERDE